MAKNPSHTMTEWVFVLDPADKQQLGMVRHLPQLFVAEEEGQVWLRGIPFAAKLPLLIRQLPAKQSFILDKKGLLFPPKGITPTQALPQLSWIPIEQFFPIKSPVSAFPGETGNKWEIQLIASQQETVPTALLTKMDLWALYADSASEIRFSGIEFATSEKQEVLILGTPLPSLPGTSYWREEDLLFPSGWELKYPILTQTIAKQLNPDENTLVLFGRDGSWVCIHKSDFVPASRSAIRLTAQQL